MKPSSHHRRVASGAPVQHLLLTLAWTWACWWAAVATGLPWDAPLATGLYVAGSLGPLGVALLLAARGLGEASAGAFLRQTFDPRRVPGRAWFAMVTLLVLGALLPVAAVAVQEGTWPWELVDPAAPFAFLFVGALAGALEEPGWRGYAQTHLQQRTSVLATSMIVGVAWALWHLPLFFLEGTYQASLGVGTPAFWGFFAAILLASPVYAWLLGTARGATFIVVAYHALGNVSAEMFGVEGAPGWEMASTAVLAVGVGIVGRHWLRRRSWPAPPDVST